MQNVLVNENFVHLLEVTCLEHPGLEVHYGGVGGFIAKKPPKRVDPMKVIQVCLVPNENTNFILSFVVTVKMFSLNIFEGLFGSTQATPVGFLSQH